MEIRGVEKKGIDTYTTEEVKEIKGKLDDQGIAISSLASPIGKINIKDDLHPIWNILNMWLSWPMY